MTELEAVAVPPVPVQLSVNVLLLVKEPVDWVPESALAPDHAPDATHDVALVDDQVSVDEAPLVTEVGLAVRDTVGAGVAVTVTVADALCVPPGPVQERLKLPLFVSAPVEAVPDVERVPDQPPAAVQEVAPVDDQVSVDDPPLTTDEGFAEIDTVGTGGGGGVPAMLTGTDALPLPFGPVQVSEKLLLALSGPVDWLPEVALVPDQAPAAEHDVAFVAFHVSVEDAPLATEVGWAARDTDGPAGDSSPAPPQAPSTSAGRSSRTLARMVARMTQGNGRRPDCFDMPAADRCRGLI